MQQKMRGSRPLRISAVREGNVLTFQIDDEPPLVIEDLFPSTAKRVDYGFIGRGLFACNGSWCHVKHSQ